MRKEGPADKVFLKRILNVGWKHKKNLSAKYESMGPVIGPKIKIVLNGNENYSLEKLKSEILKQYVNEDNKCYFEDNIIRLCTTNERIISSFIDDEGNPCNFWEYNKSLRNSRHNLTIYLLTTKIKSAEISDNSTLILKEKDNTNIRKANKLSISTFNKNIGTDQIPFDKPVKLFDEINIVTDIKINKNNSSNIKNGELTDNISLSRSSSEESIQQKQQTKSKNAMLPTNKCVNFTKENVPLNVSLSVVEKTDRSKKINYFSFIKPSEEKVKTKAIDSLNLTIRLIKEENLHFSNVILGKGGQGVVSKGKFLGSTVAIKSVSKGKNDKLTLREIKLLDKIRHPNVISIMAVCSTLTQFHIVMEYFESYSLFDIIFNPKVKNKYNVNLKNKNKIAYQISCALTFLHLQPSPIIHRDIKPSNILVNQMFESKLCELGLGKHNDINESLQSTQVGTARGTTLFMAPEIILQKKDASTKSDIWAFACTLIELFTEKDVWNLSKYFSPLMCVITNLQSKKIPNVDNVPTYLKNKLLECFDYNEENRPKMEELLKIFETQNNLSI